MGPPLVVAIDDSGAIVNAQQRKSRADRFVLKVESLRSGVILVVAFAVRLAILSQM